jgi:hypothetical protein
MYINKKFILFLAFFVYISISNTIAQNQTQNSSDWSQVKVDQLSDADLAKMQGQLQGSGMTPEQAKQMALSKGLPESEWSKLRTRLSKSGGANAGKQEDNGPTVVPSVQRETTASDYKSTPKPATSNVFGASFFDSESLSFEPNLRIATPVNYVLGPDDQLEISVSG